MGRELALLVMLLASAMAATPTGTPHVFTTTAQEAAALVTADAFTSAGYPNNNYGSESDLVNCGGNAPGLSNYYLKFDLSSTPINEVLSATLTAEWHELPGSTGNINYYLYETNTAWDEGTITWNTAPAATTQIPTLLGAGNFGLDATSFFNTRKGVSSLRTVNTYCNGWMGAWYSRHTATPPRLALTYRVPNTAPMITGMSGSPPAPVGTAVALAAQWTDNEGDNATAYFCRNSTNCANDTLGRWCSGHAASGQGAQCQYTAQASDNTTNDYYAFVCDDYENKCSASVHGTFAVIHGPYVNFVDITPAPAYRNSVLTGSGQYGDIHSREQSGSVLAWIVNGATVKNETMPRGNQYTTSTLTHAFAIGDNVTFSFRSCNEAGECAPATAVARTIENARPVIEAAERIEYYIIDPVDIQANAYDLDNDIITTTWQWWKNGVITAENTSTFPTGNARGDNITYRITATDGIDTTVFTSTIIIANHKPEFTGHGITPAAKNTTLTCTWTAWSIEENNYTATAKWEKNSAPLGLDSIVICQNNTQCTASASVPAMNVGAGDTFTCRVIADDGTDTTTSNATVTIAGVCGDGVKDVGEQCDTTAPDGYTCSACVLNANACTTCGGGGSSGGGGSTAPVNKSITSTGKAIQWPPVIDAGVARITRDFGYDTKFVTTEYTEVKTYITEEIEFLRDMRNVEYTTTIPKAFAASAGEITINGADYAVIEDDPVIKFSLGDRRIGDKATIKYSIETEKLAYGMQETVLGMPEPEIEYEEVEASGPVTPSVVTETLAPLPTPAATPVPTPEPKKADITALVTMIAGDWWWLGLAFVLAVLFYAQRKTIGTTVTRVKMPAAKAPAVKIPTAPVQMPALPESFPAAQKRRGELVGQVARAIQSSEGRFHAAGIWRELHRQYGDAVIRDRIYIEKDISSWLKEHAEYAGSYRNANYYRFGKGTNTPSAN